MYRIISFANFILWFLPFLLVSLFSSSCFIAVVKTSSIEESRESGHLCLVTDFNESVSSFSLFTVMLLISLSYIALIKLRNLYITNLSGTLTRKRCLILSKELSITNEMTILFLSLFVRSITFIDLHMLK